MPNITIDAAQLQALLDTVKSQSEALERSKRSEAERQREDAARAKSRQRQHSCSIAADAEERNRGRAHQIEWDAAYENLGRIAPACERAKQPKRIAFVSRQGSRIAPLITETSTSTRCCFANLRPSAKRS